MNARKPPPSDKTLAIAFLVLGRAGGARGARRLVALYGDCAPEDADVIVALGGDGLMLQTLHRIMDAPKPIYGMNRGSVGFLMNEYSDRDLPERLAAARPSIIHPLLMRAVDIKGARTTARAINEVSLLRQTSQAAKLRHQRRRRGAARRTDRRRRAGRDARPARPPTISPSTARSCRWARR